MSETIRHLVQGWLFTWDAEKAGTNVKKHGVSFCEACEVFFDEFYVPCDSGVHDEQRYGFLGYSRQRLLYVVAADQAGEAWRIISARQATPKERAHDEEAHDSD